jgi:hypothetical protein
MNAYLKRAREIIGERTDGEIAYDNTVIAGLAKGRDIQGAIDAANREHPGEALLPKPDQWEDLAARYDYIRQHHEILKQSTA